jgi:hypothetical protein
MPHTGMLLQVVTYIVAPYELVRFMLKINSFLLVGFCSEVECAQLHLAGLSFV